MTHAMSAFRTGAVMPRESASWDADTALEQLYAAHWRQLVRLSVLLVRDVATAEEVVQDAFVAVHGALVEAARPRQGARLPAAGGRQPLPVGPAAPRRSSPGTPPARRCPHPMPGADDAALATDRRGRRTRRDAGAARPPARGARAALLPRPLRGRDRRHPRDQPGRGEEPRLAWVRHLARPAQRLPGGPVMTRPDDQPHDEPASPSSSPTPCPTSSPPTASTPSATERR